MDISLVILAAGLGNRFGGGSAKQVAHVGAYGEIIADYSAFDAVRAGFTKIVYVINRSMEPHFSRQIASKVKGAAVGICFQDMEDLPGPHRGAGVSHRTRPWGTAHALWAARHAVDGPFMMAQADDFYGKNTFAAVYDFLVNPKYGSNVHCMPGFELGATVSEHGAVSRGICRTENGWLVDINEIKGIEKTPAGIRHPDGGEHRYLHGDAIASMGAFGFKPTIFNEIEQGFSHFLESNLHSPNAEYYLTAHVKEIIQARAASMAVLPTTDRWFGFTYKEEQELVRGEIARLTNAGVYPSPLF